MIDDIAIDLLFFKNFACIEDIRRKYNLIMNLFIAIYLLIVFFIICIFTLKKEKKNILIALIYFPNFSKFPLYFTNFFFLRNKHTHTRERERVFWHKGTPQLHSKVIVTFKEGWGKLYYTQHTLLSNVGQLPILFFSFSFFEKQTHTHTHTHARERKKVSNTKTHQNFT